MSAPDSIKKKTRTAAQSYRLGIILCTVVFNPRPIHISLALRSCVVREHLCDGAVTEQTGRECDLEGEPVFALADVEDVASVGGACCEVEGSVYIAFR